MYTLLTTLKTLVRIRMKFSPSDNPRSEGDALFFKHCARRQQDCETAGHEDIEKTHAERSGLTSLPRASNLAASGTVYAF